MTLSARSIALQGFGYGVRQIGLQGLLAQEALQQVDSGGPARFGPISTGLRRHSGIGVELPRGESDAERDRRLAFEAAKAAEAEAQFNRDHIAALVTQFQTAAVDGRMQLPPRIVLPSGRAVAPETAGEDDMALLMFALYLAMDN